MALNRIKESQLRAKLLEVIEGSFTELSHDRVAVVLGQLMRDFEGRSSQSEVGDLSSFGRRNNASQNGAAAQPTRKVSAAISEDSSTSGALKAKGHEQDSSSVADVIEDGSKITLIANEPEQIGDLLRQMLDVGAVLVKLATPRQLNALLTLRVDFRPMHLVVEVVGRVVNISARGTAIEVSQLGREDRAALEKLMAQAQADAARAAAAVAVAQSNHSPQLILPASSSISEGMGHSEEPTKLVPAPDLDRLASISGRGGVSSTFSGSPMSLLKRSHNEPMIVMRKPVELTSPDVKMVTELTRVRQTISMAGELYGPGPAWANATGDAERIEELAQDRILDILLQQAEHGFSGVVEVEWGLNNRHQLKFDGGFLVDIATMPRNADHELGPMLLMAKRIDKQQLAMAAAHADEYHVSVARALLDLELMSVEQLRHAVAGRLTFLLRDVLIIDQGKAKVFAAEALTPGFLPLPPLRVHLSIERPIFVALYERLRQYNQKARDVRVQRDLDAYPEIEPHDMERVERAITEPEHLSFVREMLTGRRRLREVFTESSLPGAETFALVFALHRMGLVSFDHSLHHTVVRERYRENVTVKYLSVHKASYFEVLNVHWSSYDEVVRRAYDELIAQFDPSVVPESMEPEVIQRVREIRERVEVAYKQLAAREVRHSYRMRIMPEYKLSHAIPLFLKQCELAEKRGSKDEAMDSLRRALEIAPEHADAPLWSQRLSALLAGEIEADASSSSF